MKLTGNATTPSLSRGSDRQDSRRRTSPETDHAAVQGHPSSPGACSHPANARCRIRRHPQLLPGRCPGHRETGGNRPFRNSRSRRATWPRSWRCRSQAARRRTLRALSQCLRERAFGQRDHPEGQRPLPRSAARRLAHSGLAAVKQSLPQHQRVAMSARRCVCVGEPIRSHRVWSLEARPANASPRLAWERARGSLAGGDARSTAVAYRPRALTAFVADDTICWFPAP